MPKVGEGGSKGPPVITGGRSKTVVSLCCSQELVKQPRATALLALLSCGSNVCRG